jgi:hypothetical protein
MQAKRAMLRGRVSEEFDVPPVVDVRGYDDEKIVVDAPDGYALPVAPIPYSELI